MPLEKVLKKPAGFTLLELLVIVVIVGILAALIVPNFVEAPGRSRDLTRKADLAKLKSALETYYNYNNYYPSSQASAGTPTCVPSASNCLLTPLTGGSTPYMTIIGADPKAGQHYTYIPSPSGCATGACISYSLTATLENTKDTDAGVNGLYTINSAN